MLAVVPSTSLTCRPYQSHFSGTACSQPSATSYTNRRITGSGSFARALQYVPLLSEQGRRPNPINRTTTRAAAAMQERFSPL